MQYPMFILLAAFLSVTLCGCGDSSKVVTQAKLDFAERNPFAQIITAYVGEGDSDHAYVHVKYRFDSPSAVGGNSSTRDVVMGYRLENKAWTLFHESSDTETK